MSLGTLNFDDISEDDLKKLIDVGIPEGLNIDYKRDLYGISDGDKKEALKDISSFANSFGGHLIIGIEENNGIPTAITGLHEINIDTEIQRLENLVRDGIEPRITGLKIKAILLESGNSVVILIRIPKSWNPPHRVSARNINRFYVRNSAGAHEVSVEELRSLFNLSASVHDRIQSFRRERLAILSAAEGPMKIEHGGRLILHIVPLSAFGYGQSLDVRQIYNCHLTFQPLSSMGNRRYNFEGVILYGGGKKCCGYTQIFRNGIIEATKAEIVIRRDGRKLIASLEFDKDIFNVLPKYLAGLKALDVPSPLAVMISLQEVHGATLGVRNDSFDDDPELFNKSELLLPEIIIEDYGTEQDYQRAMRPAFDALWNAAGYASSRYFSDDDLWRGEVMNV